MLRLRTTPIYTWRSSDEVTRSDADEVSTASGSDRVTKWASVKVRQLIALPIEHVVNCARYAAGSGHSTQRGD